MTNDHAAENSGTSSDGMPAIVFGAILLVAAFALPVGSQEAYAKRSLTFEVRPGSSSSSCPRVDRGEAVSLLADDNSDFAVHASNKGCRARLTDFSTHKRPATRRLPDYDRITGFKNPNGQSMPIVNVRYEPNLYTDDQERDRQHIAASLSNVQEIEPRYLVTGNDGLPWIEAEVDEFGVVYVKCNRLRIYLPSGREATRPEEFCKNPFPGRE